MLPPSGSQRCHQFPPYSDVDSFLTPLLVAFRLTKASRLSPAPLLQGDFCAHTQARICRTSTYHCTTADISETKRERCKNCYVYIRLVGSCPCSRITATAENFWKVLETTPFLHSLLQHLLWKVLGLVHFSLHLQFPWYKIVPQSKFLGLSEVLLSLFRLVSCLSVLSAKSRLSRER